MKSAGSLATRFLRCFPFGRLGGGRLGLRLGGLFLARLEGLWSSSSTSGGITAPIARRAILTTTPSAISTRISSPSASTTVP